MHNKTFIVDGKVMITGGRNVADEYYDYDRSFSFRDRDILLIGDAVQAANASFKAFWNHHLSASQSSHFQNKSFRSPRRHSGDSFTSTHAMKNIFKKRAARDWQLSGNLYRHWQQTKALMWLPDVQFVSDPPFKIRKTVCGEEA